MKTKLIDLLGLTNMANDIRDWVNAHFQRKVDGKGLSENDYDDTAKAKVDEIPDNPKYTDTVYDDTALSGRVSAIESKESGWDAKQDTLVSGTNIKTVNGESLLGSGNIEIQGGDENVIEAITMNGNSVPVTDKTAAITETDPTVPSWAKQQNKPTYTASEIGAIPTSEKGVAGGVATLGSDGKVPQSQLPSYVDDVLEYSNQSSFPATGESGKIYVALDTNKTYRWSGSAYVEISQSLALGETSSTAFAGDRGKAIEDKIPSNASSSNKLVTTSDISGNADKVSNATNGNFAGLDANGNLTDSGKKASDFATYSQGAKADTAYQKPSSGIPESDLSSDVQQALQKHFKGWYDSSSNLPANPVVGDYAYVKGAESTDPAAIYECTTAGTWSDSGRTADTSNVQTFASGEEVNDVHIVNDLITGGADDVLSAEQGKVLGEAVKDTIKGASINLYNKNAEGHITGKYLNHSGGYSNNANSIVTPLIPIKANTVYAYSLIRSTSANDCYFMFLADNGVTPLKPLNPLNDTEINFGGNTAPSKLFKSPANAAYAQFTCKFSSDVEDIRDYIQLIETNTLPTEYHPYKLKLPYNSLPQQLFDEIEDMEDGLEAEIATKAEYEVEICKNLINPAEVQLNKYIKFTGTTISNNQPGSHDGAACSGLIPVTPGKTYYLTRAISDNNAAFCFIEDDMATTLVALDPETDEPVAGSEQINKSRAYKAPQNAAYALICFSFSGWTFENINEQIRGFQFEEGSVATPYVPYTAPRQAIPVNHLPKEFFELEDRVEGVEEQIQIINGTKSSRFNYNSSLDVASFIESDFDENNKIRNNFTVKRSIGVSGSNAECFNFGQVVKINKSSGVSTYLGGGSDDICPVEFGSGKNYIGANHGFIQFYKCMSANHGKQYADIGSIWSNGVNNYTIMDIVDTNNLILLSENTGTYPNWTFVAPSTATYTHVSGATNTSSFIVSATATAIQGKPCEKLDETFVFVDGRRITESGDYTFGDKVIISQNYKLVNPASVLNVLHTNVGTYTSHPEYAYLEGVEYFAKLSISYIFTDAAHCYIAQTLTYLQDSTLSIFGFVQYGVSNDYGFKLYIPKSLPVNGIDFRINPNYNTSVITQAFRFESNSWENPNLPPDRFVLNNVNGVFSLGYLFDYGVGGNNRKNSIGNAITLPTTLKLYPRGIDEATGSTQIAGNSYSTVCFKIYQPTSQLNQNGKFLVNTFEYDNKLYIFADFNLAGVYELDIPDKFIGKTVDVFEKSDNVKLLTSISSNTILVSVETSNPMYGYLVAQIK